MTNSLEILEKLVSFPTLSLEPNLDLISYIEAFLAAHGVASTRVYDETGTRTNLYAVIGPETAPGVMLSGHTDVVPVEGQDWTSDPFTLVERDGRLIGRGTCDMKGFVACMMALVPEAVRRQLSRPIHFAFSYDEEIGCVGVRRLIDALAGMPVKPAFCIVGEPTSLGVVIGHKGKHSGRFVCQGIECHSSLAPRGINAVYLAADMIEELRRIQAEIDSHGLRDDAYDVPYTTLHVGNIRGGTALNIVPNHCEVGFEIRDLPEDDASAMLARLRRKADELTRVASAQHAGTGVEIVIDNEYPALETAPDEEVVSFIKSLTGANTHSKTSFGTEGGLFSARLGIPTVVCGPGDIAQAHKPDEFVTREQMSACDAMLRRLLDRLAA